MSQSKSLSRVAHQDNISLNLAIASILNASLEEITEVLKQIPQEDTGNWRSRSAGFGKKLIKWC